MSFPFHGGLRATFGDGYLAGNLETSIIGAIVWTPRGIPGRKSGSYGILSEPAVDTRVRTGRWLWSPSLGAAKQRSKASASSIPGGSGSVVEHLLAKERVVGSNPIFRSISFSGLFCPRPARGKSPNCFTAFTLATARYKKGLVKRGSANW